MLLHVYVAAKGRLTQIEIKGSSGGHGQHGERNEHSVLMNAGAHEELLTRALKSSIDEDRSQLSSDRPSWP